MPKYIQLSRKPGWRKPPNTVVVSRPSKYGNLFVVGKPFPMELYQYEDLVRSMGFTKVIKYSAGGKIDDPEEAVFCYKKFLKWAQKERPAQWQAIVIDLKGKNLACWCKPGKKTPCHAKVLLEEVRKAKMEPYYPMPGNDY